MIPIPTGVRVWLATGFPSLATLVPALKPVEFRSRSGLAAVGKCYSDRRWSRLTLFSGRDGASRRALQ